MGNTIYSQAQKLWLLSLLIEKGSFPDAAKQAGISPSALSQQLSALERYLGKTLVIRQRGLVLATEEGRELLEQVMPILQSLSQVEAEKRHASRFRKKVRLGVYESMAINFFPVLLPSIKRKHPELDLEVRTGRSHWLSTLVDRGELDLALVSEHSMNSRLDTQVFATDTLSLYVSPNHPIAGMGWDGIHQIGIGTLSTPPDGHPRYFQHFVKSIGHAPRVVMRSDSFETLRALAECGSLVSILPDRVGQRIPGRLTRLIPPQSGLDPGSHRFFVVLRRNVDTEVRRLMIEELNQLPGRAGAALSY